MNIVGAVLLMFADEETAFWLLATLCEHIMTDFFRTAMVEYLPFCFAYNFTHKRDTCTPLYP